MDLTGVYANPDWAGTGGIPARDEAYLRPEFAYHLEDVLGLDRERYAGRRAVVIGEGTFAATTVAALARLADEAPGTRVAWVTRAAADGIFPEAEHDPLPARRELRLRARALAAGAHAAVTHVGGAEVEAFDADPDTRTLPRAARGGGRAARRGGRPRGRARGLRPGRPALPRAGRRRAALRRARARAARPRARRCCSRPGYRAWATPWPGWPATRGGAA